MYHIREKPSLLGKPESLRLNGIHYITFDNP